MKYKTFARIRAVVVLALAALAGWAVFHKASANRQAAVALAPRPISAGYAVDSSSETMAVSAKPAAPRRVAAPPPGSSAAPAADPAALTDVHREVLRLQKEPLLSNGTDAGDSRKWVIKQPGWSAEFRADTSKGFDFWNRVKIDTNRNKKFEERWDFKADGTIKRRVAPADDENYTKTYALQNGKWALKG